MKIEDIRLGMKVTYFDRRSKSEAEATITAVLGRAGSRWAESVYALPDGKPQNGSETTLWLSDYKNAEGSIAGGPSWCFADNRKFRAHMENLLRPSEKAPKKAPDPRYAALDHGNNGRAREARLAAQREFVNRVTEQGFYWQRCYVRSGDLGNPWGTKLDWVKREKPQFDFDKEKGKYFLITPTGWVGGSRFGRSVRAEKPKAEGGAEKEGGK
jgi:hypothetical protein